MSGEQMKTRRWVWRNSKATSVLKKKNFIVFLRAPHSATLNWIRSTHTHTHTSRYRCIVPAALRLRNHIIMYFNNDSFFCFSPKRVLLPVILSIPHVLLRIISSFHSSSVLECIVSAFFFLSSFVDSFSFSLALTMHETMRCSFHLLSHPKT